MSEENDDNESQWLVRNDINTLKGFHLVPDIGDKTNFSRLFLRSADLKLDDAIKFVGEHSYFVRPSKRSNGVDVTAYIRHIHPASDDASDIEARKQELLRELGEAKESTEKAAKALKTIKSSIRLGYSVMGANKATTRIYKPPGHTLGEALSFILTKKVFERVVQQMILDTREEHSESLSEGRLWHARWVSARLYLLVGSALGWDWLTWPLHKLTQLWQKD